MHWVRLSAVSRFIFSSSISCAPIFIRAHYSCFASLPSHLVSALRSNHALDGRSVWCRHLVHVLTTRPSTALAYSVEVSLVYLLVARIFTLCNICKKSERCALVVTMIRHRSITRTACSIFTSSCLYRSRSGLGNYFSIR